MERDVHVHEFSVAFSDTMTCSAFADQPYCHPERERESERASGQFCDDTGASATVCSSCGITTAHAPVLLEQT